MNFAAIKTKNLFIPLLRASYAYPHHPTYYLYLFIVDSSNRKFRLFFRFYLTTIRQAPFVFSFSIFFISPLALLLFIPHKSALSLNFPCCVDQYNIHVRHVHTLMYNERRNFQEGAEATH